METITRTFASSNEARVAADRLRTDLGEERVTLLTPDMSGRAVEREANTEPGERPGMGAAVGGVVGGAIGMATANLLLPGVGAIVVAGVLAAGAAGAAAGGAAGATLEERLSTAVSREQLTDCLDGLRAGRSVVIAEVDGDAEEARVRRTLGLDDGSAAARC